MKPRALITGASRGIGAAIAEALAKAGHPIIANYRIDRSGAESVKQRIENKEYVIVGVNEYQSEVTQPLELFQFNPEEEDQQLQRLTQTKLSRSSSQVASALSNLKQAAQKDSNLMPSVLEAVEGGATEGEIMGVLQEVYGEYVDPGVF